MTLRILLAGPLLLSIACSSTSPSPAAPGDGGTSHPTDGGGDASGDDTDGGPVNKPLVLNGTEKITLAFTAGDIANYCPNVDGALLSTTIIVDLATGKATRTVSTAECADAAVASDASPSKGTTSTVDASGTATGTESSAVISAVEALVPAPSKTCGADAGTRTIFIDRGNGATETYGWTYDNPDCPAGKPVVDGTALQHVFDAAGAIF